MYTLQSKRRRETGKVPVKIPTIVLTVGIFEIPAVPHCSPHPPLRCVAYIPGLGTNHLGYSREMIHNIAEAVLTLLSIFGCGSSCSVLGAVCPDCPVII
mmetsp:Transcript_59136/g.105533  ORF Transcript_59136/g.105533 Transcript_59136/m.105533 type:complete len:99 (-) Transcript_59136:1365-1661(-)